MSSVNRAILIGNLGKDPEHKVLPSGSRVCNASIATSETWKNKDGSKGEETTWHDIELWNDRADNFHKFLKKGAKVYVEGSIKKNKNEETGVWYTKIKADRWEFMDSKGSQSGDSTPSQEPAFAEDDIPF
jgi:single-strand DNA-binding protein